MKKRTKISLVLSSAAAILLAGSIMAGGTYALFTSESKTNIVVSSGTVNIDAKVKNFKTYSGVDLTGDPNTDEIRETAVNGTFTNGGKASYDEETGKFTLEKMTPGDKVEFTIEVTNLSNVSIKYRNSLQLDQTTSSDLFSALKVSFNNETFDGSTVSHWKTLEVGTNPENLNVVIELPSNVENDYQDKSCTIVNTVEAVQGNAAVYDVEVNDEDGLLAALNSSTDSTSINVTENITLSGRYTIKTKNLNIYGDGDKTITTEDARFFNIFGDEYDMNNGSLHLNNIKLSFYEDTEHYVYNDTRFINIYGVTNFDLTIDNSSIKTSGYAINIAPNNNNVNVVARNSTFSGYASVVSWSPNCTFSFDNCTLIGKNQWPAGSNDFAIVVVVNDATNNVINLTNCELEACEDTNLDNPAVEYLFDIRNDSSSVLYDSSNCTFKRHAKKNGQVVDIICDLSNENSVRSESCQAVGRYVDKISSMNSIAN